MAFVVFLQKDALAGNRTRASRVAGENSTTEPPVLLAGQKFSNFAIILSELLHLPLSFILHMHAKERRRRRRGRKREFGPETKD